MACGDIALTKEIAGNIATIKPNRARTHKQLDDGTCCKEARSLSRSYKPHLKVKLSAAKISTKFARENCVYASWRQLGVDNLCLLPCLTYFPDFQIIV